jgi:hypothetical protein
MRNIFLILLLTPIFSFAQTENTVQSKNELGLNLFSFSDFSATTYPATKFGSNLNFGNGIYYKFHTNKNVWRSSISFFKQKIVINDGQQFEGYSFHSNGIKKAGEAKVGYQRDFCSGKLSPFIFSEFSFLYSKYTGHASEMGCFGYYGDRPFDIESFEYGISGGIGLRYEITKNIVVSIESNAKGVLSVNEDMLNHSPYYPKYKNFDYRFNPLSRLGVAIAF